MKKAQIKDLLRHLNNKDEIIKISELGKVYLRLDGKYFVRIDIKRPESIERIDSKREKIRKALKRLKYMIISAGFKFRKEFYFDHNNNLFVVRVPKTEVENHGKYIRNVKKISIQLKDDLKTCNIGIYIIERGTIKNYEFACEVHKDDLVDFLKTLKKGEIRRPQEKPKFVKRWDGLKPFEPRFHWKGPA